MAAAPTYTLSLHDALPILVPPGTPPSTPPGTPSDTPVDGASGMISFGASIGAALGLVTGTGWIFGCAAGVGGGDRKSTRLNSSRSQISYAVICLKKKSSIH